MGVIEVLKKVYNYLYEPDNETFEDDEETCGECGGTGHEDIFHDCEKCGGAGKVKKGYMYDI